MVCVEGRYGILFDRINGITLTQLCEKDPDNIKNYAKLYVEELRKTHSLSIEGEELPSETDIIIDAMDHMFRSEKWKKNFKDMVALIEKEFPKEVLLHGDRHPGNVMIQNGEPIWIDLGYIAKGPAIYDLASMYLIWMAPMAQLFLSSAAAVKLSNSQKKEFYEIVVSSFAKMNNRSDIKHVKWLIQQSMILFVTMSFYREGLGEIKSGILKEIYYGIVKALFCLGFIWYRRER